MEGLTYSKARALFKNHGVELNKPMLYISDSKVLVIRHKVEAGVRYFDFEKILPFEGSIICRAYENGRTFTGKTAYPKSAKHIEIA